MARPRLDAVYTGTGPRDLRGSPYHDPTPKVWYTAEYRMNTGHWVMERRFEAASDAEAKRLAREALPERKPTDKTYMYVSRITADD